MSEVTALMLIRANGRPVPVEDLVMVDGEQYCLARCTAVNSEQHAVKLIEELAGNKFYQQLLYYNAICFAVGEVVDRQLRINMVKLSYIEPENELPI